MQDIYIDDIRLEHVRSHEEMEMDFPVDNFTVITGKNGAGKSTVFKSISMCLYGDDGGKKGERLNISDMVPEKSPKDLAMIMNFRIIENDVTDTYQIKLYQNHSKFKNSFLLIKNGIDISGENKTATYELISRLLIPRDVYHNTVYFTQQVKDFFTALTNAEQKDIFDSILSMKIYDTYYKNTDGQLKKLLEQLQILLNEISILTSKRDMKVIFKTQLQETNAKQEEIRVEKLSALKQQRIETENEIEVKTLALGELDDVEDEYDNVSRDLIEQQGQKKIIVQQIEDKKQAVRDTISGELRSILNDLEVSKHQKIASEERVMNENINTKKTRIIAIGKEISEIIKRYDTTSVQKEINEYKSEKQTEINTINRMISDLVIEFPTDELDEQITVRKAWFVDAIDLLKTKAEEIKSSAKVVQGNIVSTQKVIDEDEASLNQPTSTCSKCLRPFSDEASSHAVRNQIEENKIKISKLQEQIELFKADMAKIKSEHEETTVQRDLEMKNLQERIAHILDNRAKKQSDLNRKLILLSEEIEEHVRDLNDKIQKLKESASQETVLLVEEERKLYDDVSSLTDDLEKSKLMIEESFEKDRNNSTEEHKLKCINQIIQLNQNYQKSIDGLDKLIYELTESQKSLLLSKTKIRDLKNDIIKLNANLTNTINSIHENENGVVTDDSQILKIDSDVKEINEKLVEINTKKSLLERDISILEFWKTAFSDSGIKSMLIDVAIPYMNENVSECLEMTVPGVFTVTFDTLKTTKSGEMKDRFNVNVRHNIKGTSSHKKLSGGEKRIVDIACMYALRGLTEKLYGKRFHNIFYDEVLDALDEDTAAIFCQMSKLMARDKNITLITHKLVDNVEPDRSFNL